MSVLITRQVSFGNGHVLVTGRADDGVTASVIVGQDIVNNGDVYPVLETATERNRIKIAGIFAHDQATQRG